MRFSTLCNLPKSLHPQVRIRLNFACTKGLWQGTPKTNLNEFHGMDAEQMWVKVQTLRLNISKTVRDTAVKFGSMVGLVDLYQPDFFQIFPATGLVVVKGQSSNFDVKYLWNGMLNFVHFWHVDRA